MKIARAVAKDEKPNPDDLMQYICNGDYLYEYDNRVKTVTIIHRSKIGTCNNLLHDLMSGTTAAGALHRFDLTLVKVDEMYVYIQAKPKKGDENAEFEGMTLVLCNGDVKGRAYIPRQIKITNSNGQETELWDFPDPKVNPKGIDKNFFEPAPLQDGWRIKRIEASSRTLKTDLEELIRQSRK